MTALHKHPSPEVSICVVTYNRYKYLLECLDSIYKSTYKNFEVLVFDNHSKKRLTEEILSKYPRVKYFYHDKNIGGAGGRSFCEKRSKGKYVMMLDDDTVIDEKMIAELVHAMESDPKIGIVGPKVFFYDGGKTNILLCGLGRISKVTTLCKDIVYRQQDRGQFDYIAAIDYSQDGFMVRKTVSELVGGHDVKLVMTYMETDYFIRVQHRGYKTVFIPTAKLWHKVHLTPRKISVLRDELGLVSAIRIYYNMRNRSIFAKRYFSRGAKILYILFILHLFFLFYLYKFIIYKASKEYFRNLCEGYIHGILIFLGLKQL